MHIILLSHSYLRVTIILSLLIAATAGAAVISTQNKPDSLTKAPTTTDKEITSPSRTSPKSSGNPTTADTPAKQDTPAEQKTGNGQTAPSTTPKTTDKKSTQSGSTSKPTAPGQSAPTPTPSPSVPAVITPPVLPAVPSNPSGQSVPRADIGAFKHIFYDDFTKDASLGSWGEDWDGNKIVYTGAQNQQWRAYPKSYKDTYDKRPYRSDQVLSVRNSILNFHLHQVDGVPAGANPSPLINGSQYQTYGRYSTRFKVDTNTLSEYYVAWLLWPQSERWPQDGEIDFPEGQLSGNVGGFHHYAGAGSCTNGCQDAANVPANTKFTDWHTYTIEWTPGRVKFILDGNTVLNSTNWVPSGPMRWQLQTETNGNGNHSGNLMVDWVSVWKYQP